MNMRTESILPVLLFGFVTVSQVRAQQNAPSKPLAPPEDDVIRVETSLVTLPVKVSDRRGKVVYDLSREQFRVFENGVEQEIAYFEPPASADERNPNSKPLVVALLLDVSDSTQFKLARIRSAALAFVDLLRPGDRLIVVSFDKQVRLLTEVTDDRDVIHQAINRIKTGGGTSLYAALSEIITQAFARVAGRKAIVLLTDGVDTTSKNATSESTIRAAEASDTAVFPIQYHTYSDFSDNPSRETYTSGSLGAVAHVTKNGEFASEAYKKATLYLRLLADKTAGHFQFADTAKNLASSFESIARQLREQYALGYYPKDKSISERQIEVKVTVPGTTVRTRNRYLYRSSPRPD
jgi:Ca-activated chloride channel family protein